MKLLRVLAGFALVAAAGFAADYKIAPTRGNLTFTIEHKLLGTVLGNFSVYEGAAVTDGDKIVSLNGEIDVAAISTDNTKRDAHLKNDDFFDEPKFKKITFKSTASESGKITGDLTMHGLTKPVTFTVKRDKESGGSLDFFIVEGVLKRSDFKIGDTTMNNMQIADEVKVKLLFR